MFDLNEIQDLPKEDLINHIKKLRQHVDQLTNIIKNNQNKVNKKIYKNKREFDFSKYGKRHICLKLFYLGWNYDGFVLQENTSNTIEHYLFYTLLKTHLIEDEKTCKYNKSGRTDKKVSAYCQVVSLDVRSNFKNYKLEGEVDYFNIENSKEINYCKILNKVLPKDIRALAWSPVNNSFNARFNCKRRSYVYYFPLGTLDINALNKACSYLIGTYDFRNFCKLDKTKEKINFVRTIYEVNLKKFLTSDLNNSAFDIYELKITSNSFLWHQIRCIVSILFLIGQGNEKPELILDLLYIEKYPKKPQYTLSNSIPLMLFDCEYESISDSDWIYDKEALTDALNSLKSCWFEYTIKSNICFSMLKSLNNVPMAKTLENYKTLQYEVMKELNTKNYKPLTEREFCETELNKKLKDKLAFNLKHRKLQKLILLDK